LNQYSIVIEKRKSDFKLGIDVDTTHGSALLIDAVTGGLVDEWNRHHPDRQVKAGDHIVEVNGVSGNAQAVFKECKFANRLDMKICRGRLGGQPGEAERSILPSLCVVSWNVLASAYTNLKTYPDIDPGILRASRRRAQAKAALAFLSADVICLQEVDCPIAELGLGPEYDHISAQRPEGRRDCCVIAWKRDRLEVSPRGHRMIVFDQHPPPAAFECDPAHYETGNVGIAVELRVRSDPGSSVTVATTHLCWEPHKMDVREWQLYLFFHLVSEFAGPRILLCGDLNSQPGTQPHQFLAQGCGLMSAYADVEARALTNANAHAGDGGFAAMIDYIWYSPKWFSVRQRIELPTADDLRARNPRSHALAAREPVPTLLSARWPSDHLALGAVLELTNPVMDPWEFD